MTRASAQRLRPRSSRGAKAAANMDGDGEKPMPPEVAGSVARIRSFDGREPRTWTAHIPAWQSTFTFLMLIASLGDEMYKWAVLFYFARTELAARDVAIHIHLSDARSLPRTA